MRQSSWLLWGLGLGASLVLFSFSFDNRFRDDDFVFLNHVAAHRSMGDLVRPARDFAFYRPAAILLFALEHHLFGMHGGLYILFNYLLHVLNASLLLAILLGAGLHEKAAALAAALFVLGFGHYAKEVMWACTSGPLASVALGLVALLLCCRGVVRGGTPAQRAGRRRDILSTAAVASALAIAPLLHEASLVAPALVLAMERWLCGAQESRRRWTRMLLFSLPSLAWATILLALSRDYHAYRDAAHQVVRVPAYLFRYLGFMPLPVQASQVACAPYAQLLVSAAVLIASVVLLRRGSRASKLLVEWL